MKTENTKPNNPSVYPDPMRGAEQSFSNQSPWQLESGMTLRDHFANSAMQALLNYPDTATTYYETNRLDYVSKCSYEIADAMLKQREL